MKNKIEERVKGLLEKGEEIERIEKPAKGRFFTIQTLIVLSFTLTISVCAMIELVDYYGFGVIWAPLAVSAFCILIYMLFATLYYKNIFYCITNKRLIIRSGIVGADYKAVEFKDVSKVEVKRIWFDKWFKRNSGTIILGSLEDGDIEQNFDEVCALFRLSGVSNVKELESFIIEKVESNKPQEEAKESSWKSVKKTAGTKKQKHEQTVVQEEMPQAEGGKEADKDVKNTTTQKKPSAKKKK